jgi:metal-dependent amidase/aminoacylase/carboxypeptidase family protein
MNAEKIKKAIRRQSHLMQETNAFIYTHPELAYEERACSAYLCEALEKSGLVVERSIADIETAFRATLLGDIDSPRVGLVVVYDAVPTIQPDGSYSPDHSCGHNVIAGGDRRRFGSYDHAPLRRLSPHGPHP